MGGKQHGDVIGVAELAQQSDDPGGAAHVEVGKRLIEQQQPRAAHQGMRHENPLLLSTGEIPDSPVGEGRGADGAQHFFDTGLPGL